MTRQVLIDGVQSWLSGNGYDLSRKEVRVFLTRWRLYQDGERFLLNPPGRAQFFTHLMRYSHCYGSRVPRRLRVINYLNAFGALVTGYRHFHLLEDWRVKATRSLRRMLGPSVPST